MEETPTPFAELDHGPSKFEEFLEKNQKLLITGSVAVFLGVLGYVGYTSYGDYKSAEAGSALSAANDATAIETVINTYGQTATAGSAALLLSQEQSEESSEKSIETLRDFVSTYPSHPALPSATTKLGLALLNAGKLTDAQSYLSEVIDMENAEHIVPAAKIGLGDIAKANGDTAQAKQLYTEVADLTKQGADAINKFSLYSSIANSRLRFLDAAAPVEVEKKVTPPTPATPAVVTPQISPAVQSSDKNAPQGE